MKLRATTIEWIGLLVAKTTTSCRTSKEKNTPKGSGAEQGSLRNVAGQQLERVRIESPQLCRCDSESQRYEGGLRMAEYGPIGTRGWRLDDDWSPPEGYAPPQVPPQSNREIQHTEPQLLPLPSTPEAVKDCVIRAVVRLIFILLVLGVIVEHAISRGSSLQADDHQYHRRHSVRRMSLQAVAGRYEQYFSTYSTALKDPNAAISAVNAERPADQPYANNQHIRTTTQVAVVTPG